jgi:hypothetical protein
MSGVRMDRAAKQRQRQAPSRAVCWRCGLRREATIHGSDAWWQHDYVPGILTRSP